MQRLVTIVSAIVLTGAATGLGITSAISRSVANPEFYYGLLKPVNLPQAVFTAAERIAGKESQTADLARSVVLRLDAPIRQQTHAGLVNLFDYLRGKEPEFRFSYDLAAAKNDPQLVAAVGDSLQKNSRLKMLPRGLLDPLVRQLVRQMPDQVDMLGVARVKPEEMTKTRALTVTWFALLNRWQIILLAVALVSLAVIFLVTRRLGTLLLASGIACIVSGLLLLLPWLFSGAIYDSLKLGGPVFEYLRDTALLKLFYAELVAVYATSPFVLLGTGTALVVTGRVMGKKPT